MKRIDRLSVSYGTILHRTKNGRIILFINQKNILSRYQVLELSVEFY